MIGLKNGLSFKIVKTKWKNETTSHPRHVYKNVAVIHFDNSQKRLVYDDCRDDEGNELSMYFSDDEGECDLTKLVTKIVFSKGWSIVAHQYHKYGVTVVLEKEPHDH